MAAALARQTWSGAVGALVAGRTLLPVTRRAPKVFYGGAFSGHRGGPQVKIDLLRQTFPEYRFDFNLVYLVSGALFMPDTGFQFLRRADIPVVLNQNGVFYPAWARTGWEEQNARMARAMANATHVFYQSEFCRRCADKFLNVRPASSEILYNAVDTNVFRPDVNKSPSRRFRFLMAGNLSSAVFYRVQNVLEGFAKAVAGGMDVELTIAGLSSNDEQAQVRGVADSLRVSDRVSVLGPYTRGQAPELFRSADAYIMNKPNDPCPNVVIEAMASGLPVLYSASGGVPELVGDSAGVGVPVPESFEENLVPSALDLAEGMMGIMERHADFAPVARARVVERFALPRWMERHADVFSRLLMNRGG